jgi:hypothetical protein
MVMVEPITSAADMPDAAVALGAGRAGGALITWIATVRVSPPVSAGATEAGWEVDGAGGAAGAGGAGGAGGAASTGGADTRVSASGRGVSGRSTQ